MTNKFVVTELTLGWPVIETSRGFVRGCAPFGQVDFIYNKTEGGLDRQHRITISDLFNLEEVKSIEELVQKAIQRGKEIDNE